MNAKNITDVEEVNRLIRSCEENDKQLRELYDNEIKRISLEYNRKMELILERRVENKIVIKYCKKMLTTIDEDEGKRILDEYQKEINAFYKERGY
jgi:hypothetical protein